MNKTKTVFLSLLCFSLLSVTYAQTFKKQELPKTQIVIVGSVHQPTQHFKIQNIVNILQRVKPDVILMELPIDWYPKKTIPEIIKDSKQIWVGLDGTGKYLSSHKNVIYRYFDISGRNKFYKKTNYFARESSWSKTLNEQYRKNKFNEKAKQALQEENIVFDISYTFSKDYPRVINSSAYYKVEKLKQSIVFKCNMIIAENVPALSKFKDFWILEKNYWDKRNHTMVKNIIKFSNEFQGKRIVVVTGSEHTYYQRELLEAHKNKNYVLKEYWQYPENKK